MRTSLKLIFYIVFTAMLWLWTGLKVFGRVLRLVWRLWVKFDQWLAPVIKGSRKFAFWGSSTLSATIVALALSMTVDMYVLNPLNEIRKESGYSWRTYRMIVLSSVLVPNPGQPMNDLQKDLVFNFAGLSPELRAFAEKVGKCESSDIPLATQVNDHGGGEFSIDRGYLQINSKFWKDLYENKTYPEGEAFSALLSVDHMERVIDIQGMEAWVCYEEGVPIPMSKPRRGQLVELHSGVNFSGG